MEKKIILVVDDEPGILEVYGIFLGEEFLDHEIVTARRYEDAQEIISANFDRIAGACLDETIIGEGTGSDLAKEMRDKGFKGSIVSISSQDLKERLALFDTQFKKPFTPSGLVALMRKLLG